MQFWQHGNNPTATENNIAGQQLLCKRGCGPEQLSEKRAGRRELIVSVPGQTGRENRGVSLRRNEGGQDRSTCCLSCLQKPHSFFACLKLHGRFPHSQTSSRHWWSRDNWNLLWRKEQRKGGTLTGDKFRSMPITLLAALLLSSTVTSHLGCFQDLMKVLQGTYLMSKRYLQLH